MEPNKDSYQATAKLKAFGSMLSSGQCFGKENKMVQEGMVNKDDERVPLSQAQSSRHSVKNSQTEGLKGCGAAVVATMVALVSCVRDKVALVNAIFHSHCI